MKKQVLMLLVGTLVMCLAMPVFAAKPRVLKFSSIHEPSHPSAITAEFFAKRVGQLTNNEVEVSTSGGQLNVEFDKVDDGYRNVWLKGPVEMVFTGEIDI